MMDHALAHLCQNFNTLMSLNTGIPPETVQYFLNELIFSLFDARPPLPHDLKLSLYDHFWKLLLHFVVQSRKLDDSLYPIGYLGSDLSNFKVKGIEQVYRDQAALYVKDFLLGKRFSYFLSKALDITETASNPEDPVILRILSIISYLPYAFSVIDERLIIRKFLPGVYSSCLKNTLMDCPPSDYMALSIDCLKSWLSFAMLQHDSVDSMRTVCHKIMPHLPRILALKRLKHRNVSMSIALLCIKLLTDNQSFISSFGELLLENVLFEFLFSEDHDLASLSRLHLRSRKADSISCTFPSNVTETIVCHSGFFEFLFSIIAKLTLYAFSLDEGKIFFSDMLDFFVSNIVVEDALNLSDISPTYIIFDFRFDRLPNEVLNALGVFFMLYDHFYPKELAIRIQSYEASPLLCEIFRTILDNFSVLHAIFPRYSKDILGTGLMSLSSRLKTTSPEYLVSNSTLVAPKIPAKYIHQKNWVSLALLRGRHLCRASRLEFKKYIVAVLPKLLSIRVDPDPDPKQMSIREFCDEVLAELASLHGTSLLSRFFGDFMPFILHDLSLWLHSSTNFRASGATCIPKILSFLSQFNYKISLWDPLGPAFIDKFIDRVHLFEEDPFSCIDCLEIISKLFPKQILAENDDEVVEWNQYCAVSTETAINQHMVRVVDQDLLERIIFLTVHFLGSDVIDIRSKAARCICRLLVYYSVENPLPAIVKIWATACYVSTSSFCAQYTIETYSSIFALFSSLLSKGDHSFMESKVNDLQKVVDSFYSTSISPDVALLELDCLVESLVTFKTLSYEFVNLLWRYYFVPKIIKSEDYRLDPSLLSLSATIPEYVFYLIASTVGKNICVDRSIKLSFECLPSSQKFPTHSIQKIESLLDVLFPM